MDQHGSTLLSKATLAKTMRALYNHNHNHNVYIQYALATVVTVLTSLYF